MRRQVGWLFAVILAVLVYLVGLILVSYAALFAYWTYPIARGENARDHKIGQAGYFEIEKRTGAKPQAPASRFMPSSSAHFARGINAPHQANTAKNIRLRGHVGGSIEAVAIQGNYAYIGEGYGVTVLSLTNPSLPTVVGSSGLMAGIITAIVVQGDYAYVTDGRGEFLHIIDLSNPDRPIEVGRFHTDWYTNDLYVLNQYAYLIDTGRDDSNIVHIINISDATNPVEVSNIATFYDLYDVFAQGKYLYIADGSAMQIFDVSIPASPAKVGEYAPANGVDHIYISDNYAYVTGYGGNFSIVNISNPAAPALVGSYSGVGSVEDLIVNSNLAYLTSGTDGLTILNVTNPTAPTKVSNYNTPGSALKVAFTGSYAYIADDSSLAILDISNVNAPRSVGAYRVPLAPVGVGMSYSINNTLYLASSYEDGLYSIDISNPALLKPVGQYKTVATGLEVFSDYAYVATGYDGGLKMINIRDPQAPTLAGVYTATTMINHVAADFSYAYLATGLDGLRIIAINNPPNLHEVSAYNTPGNARDVVVGTNYAYVADGDAGVQIIDIHNPAAPTLAGTYNTPGTAYALYLDRYLYVADGFSGLRILNINNPSAPTEIGAYDTPGSAEQVFVENNLAYIADRYSGLRIINVSNSAAPVEAGFYDTLDAEDVVASNGWIFVATGDAGLVSLHYPDCYKLFRRRTGSGSNPTATPDRSVNCPQDEYTPQQFITLVSNPAPSWRVANWMGTDHDQTQSINNTLTMPAADQEVTVNYAPTCYALTLTHSGTGGDPTATPPNSEGCAVGQYVAGQNITLHSTPGTGYTVGSWQGTANDNSTASDNTLVMSAHTQSAIVIYQLACYTLTLTHTGSGTDPGAAPPQAAGCTTGKYHFNDRIDLSASPASGWVVNAWSGTVNNAITATANSLIMPANDYRAEVHYGEAPVPAQGDLYELDNTCTRSRPVTTDGSEVQQHSFHVGGDADWVRFDAVANVRYRIEVSVPPTSTADVVMEVYGDCASAPLDTWNASFSPGARLDISRTVSGPTYIRLSNNDPVVAGDRVRYALAVRKLADAPTNRALLIVAGRLKLNDPVQPNIDKVASNVYKLFQRNGYEDKNIQVFASNANLPGYAGAASKANLQAAIQQAAGKVANGVFTLYMVDHGSPELFYLDGVGQETVTPAELNDWLNSLESAAPGVKVNVIIEACESGSFIAKPGSISKLGRVVLTSSNADNDAKASKEGAYFSDHLLTWLQQGFNLSASFFEARSAAKSIYTLQDAWLDSNGNGLANEFDDASLAAQRSFAYAGSLPGNEWPPHIFQAAVVGEVNDQKARLRVDVRDDGGVRQVWAIVYGPDYAPPPPSQVLQREVLPTFLFTRVDNENHWEAEVTGLTKPGAYRLVIQADDEEGLVAGPVTLEVSTVRGSQVYLPLIRR